MNLLDVRRVAVKVAHLGPFLALIGLLTLADLDHEYVDAGPCLLVGLGMAIVGTVVYLLTFFEEGRRTAV